MENKIEMGVDIGGSHISSACVSFRDLKILKKTELSGKLSNNSIKKDIFEVWTQIINKTIVACAAQVNTKIAYAMPGPFGYVLWKAKFKNNSKYQSLHNILVREELAKQLVASKEEMRFPNDAKAFVLGNVAIGKAKKYRTVLSLTLWNGFESAFLNNGTQQVETKGVLTNGLFWDKAFGDSLSDDYFSTRRFTQKYAEGTIKETKGVKGTAIDYSFIRYSNFKEFGYNLGQFLTLHLHNFKRDVIIPGDNISKTIHRFLPFLIS